MARLFSFRLLLAGLAILSSSSCEKVHRVYFVPIGNAPLAEINLLIPHYRDRLGVVGRVLSPMRVTASDFDTARNQLIAENVIDSMIRAYPRYAADKSVVMIGITAQDMYARSMDWRYCFGWRSAGNTAVVSTARMEWQDPTRAPDPALLSKRLRKMVTKDLGIMSFRLPPNGNPKSVLYDGILGLEDLDQVSEDFEPLAGSESTEGASAHAENDGSFPVWRISLETERHAASGLTGMLASRKLTVAGLQKENSLEVDLRSGKFVVQRTDLFVPDSVPLALTRSYYNFGQREAAWSGAFGAGSSLNYDFCPFGSRDPYTFINLYVGDGNYLHFNRISKGTAMKMRYMSIQRPCYFETPVFGGVVEDGAWVFRTARNICYRKTTTGRHSPKERRMKCGRPKVSACSICVTANGTCGS